MLTLKTQLCSCLTKALKNLLVSHRSNHRYMDKQTKKKKKKERKKLDLTVLILTSVVFAGKCLVERPERKPAKEKKK